MGSISVGQIIGSYRVVRLLGEGGMGAVYEAVHTTLNRRVAIKALHAQYAGDPVSAARFLQEAKSANLVQHPGVVQIFEFGQLSDGTAYFIMEYLQGETLSARIRRAAAQPGGRVGMPALVSCCAVAKVCAVVHRQGLVHRDLKPANIMIVSDPDVPGGERIKLLDFGIVKATQAAGVGDGGTADVKTRTGSVMGTPHYMAPEQWRSHKQIDGKADVYALGVIQYQLLTGSLPFDDDDLPVLGMKHCFEPPRPLTELDPSLRSDVAALGMQMLEKDPALRPSMSEVATELGQILGVLSEAELQRRSANPRPVVPHMPAAAAPAGAALAAAAIAKVAKKQREQDKVNIPAQAAAIPTVPMRASPPAVAKNFASETAPTLPLPRRFSRIVIMLGALGILGGAWVVVRNRSPSTYPVSQNFSVAAESADLAFPMDLVLLQQEDLTSPQEEVLASPQLEDLASPKPLDLELPALRQRPGLRAGKPTPSKQCEPILPTTACIQGANLTMDKRELLIEAFRKSDAKICVGERLLLDGLPKAPRLAAIPPSLQRDNRVARALTLTLRGLLGSSEYPSQVAVRCESP